MMHRWYSMPLILLLMLTALLTACGGSSATDTPKPAAPTTAYVLTLGTQPADIDKMKQAAIVIIQTWKFLQ